MRSIIVMLGCVTGMVLASQAEAQPATAYPFKVCVQGQACTAPVQTYSIPAAEVQCNQATVTPAPGTVHNGRFVRWDDPTNANRDCVWDSGATSGPLWSLPFSTTIVYDAVIQESNAAGTSPESARSNPFDRPGSVPNVLTGLRIVP